jgi:hypothetical protein
MGSWAVVVVVVAVAVAVMVFAWKADQKRRLALQAWASHRGWTYVDRNDEILGRVDRSPFESGRTPRATTLRT